MTEHSDTETVYSGETLEEAHRAVIMLHGRGATAEGIIELADQLPEGAYLAPQASGRTWYPHSFLEPIEKNQPYLNSALERVSSLIDQLDAHGISEEKTVILGFSQGACLASEFVARNPERYGGLICLSGGLIGEEVGEFHGNLEETSVFIGCAENDPHIPIERVETTETVLNSLNASIEKYIFEGSYHGIKPYEIEAATGIIEEI